MSKIFKSMSISRMIPEYFEDGLHLFTFDLVDHNIELMIIGL